MRSYAEQKTSRNEEYIERVSGASLQLATLARMLGPSHGSNQS